MNAACPKCGADSDDVGSKYVCGQCYWVFDKGGAGPARTMIDVPTPQVPTMTKAPAPTPTVRPAAPNPAAPPQAPGQPQMQATGASSGASSGASAVPTVCPKCSGNLVNIGGKPVCEKCFHTVEVAPGAPQAGAPQAGGPQAAGNAAGQGAAHVNPQPAPSANNSGAAPRPTTTGNQQAMKPPGPAPQSGPVCPKCSGNLVAIGGDSVCEKCFHTVEGGAGAAKPSAPPGNAPQPMQSSSPGMAATPSSSYAPQPTPSLSAPQDSAQSSLGICPKCNGNLMDIGGKPVCEQCFHVVDTPSAPTKSSSPFGAAAAPQKQAPPAPTTCPKCSGKLVEAGGNLVCGDCYHVVDQAYKPSPPSSIGNNFSPRRTGTASDDTEMSPQMIGGIALILLLILMIVVLAIRH